MTVHPKDNPELRLNIRIDGDLYRQLKAKAASQGLTISNVTRQLIEDWLAKDKPTFTEDKPIEPQKY